jgi:hypothetical protein
MKFLVDLIYGISTNKDMDTAKIKTADLLKKSKKSVKIISGNLYHVFYDSKEIYDAFKELTNNCHERDIDIIIGPKIDPKTNKILEFAKAGKINIYSNNKYPEKHYTIIDNKIVRAEVNHNVSDLAITKAHILNNSIFLAKKLAFEFDVLKQQSKKLTFESKNSKKTIKNTSTK